MKGFNTNIEQDTLENNNFRKVIYTATHSQVVLMCLRPTEDIGFEIHEDNDQFFRFEAGQGKVVIDDAAYSVGDGSAIVVPAGARHNISNVSDSETLKFYTIYSPAHHRDGIIHATKAEAQADEASGNDHFEGITIE